MKELIGEKIRIQRLTKGYSQEYMANELDLSVSAYSNIERGVTDLTVKRLFEIAEVLDVNALALLAESDTKPILRDPDLVWYKSELESLKKEVEGLRKEFSQKKVNRKTKK